MKKSSLLLLPTVLAVSTTPRTKPVQRESARTGSTNAVTRKPKNFTLDFVFTVGG